MSRYSTLSLTAISLLGLTSACTPDMGEAQPWVPAEQIEGVYRPDIVEAPTPARARGAVDGRLRVVTYNVERGTDPEGIADAFSENEELAHADLVLVQEIEAYPGEGRSRTDRLADLLHMGYAYAPERVEGDGTHGLAIMSIYPMSNVQVMLLPQVDLKWSKRQRIALAADVHVGDETFRVINVHLDTRLSIQQRILQLRPAIIDAPDRVVVGGDMNTNPFMWTDGSIPNLPVNVVTGHDQAPLLDDYMQHLGFHTPTASSGPTNHTPIMDTRLDSIFVRDLAAAPGRVERSIGLSDHWPLWIDLL